MSTTTNLHIHVKMFITNDGHSACAHGGSLVVEDPPHTHNHFFRPIIRGPGGGGFGCTTSKARPCILTNHSFQQLIQHTKRPTVNTWTQRKKKHLIMFTYTFSSCNLLRYTDLEWLLFFSFFQFAHFNYNIEHAISTTCLAVPN